MEAQLLSAAGAARPARSFRIQRQVASATALRGSTRPMAGGVAPAVSTPRSSCSRSRYSSPAVRLAAVSAMLTCSTSLSESRFRMASRVRRSLRLEEIMGAPG